MRVLLRKKLGLVLLAFAFCYLPLSNVSAEIYKWVDSNGRTHYGEEPPEDDSIKSTQIRYRSSAKRKTEQQIEAATSSTDSKTKTSVEQENEEAESQTKQQTGQANNSAENIENAQKLRCQQARTEQIILSQEMPIYFDEKDKLRARWGRDTYTGERTYIEDDERTDLLEKTQKSIKEHCKEPADEEAQQQAQQKWIRSEYCLLNRAVLAEMEKPERRTSNSELRQQRALTEEFCTENPDEVPSGWSVIELIR